MFVVEDYEFVHSLLTLNIDIDGSRPSSSGRLRKKNREGDKDESEEVGNYGAVYLNTCSNKLPRKSPIIDSDKDTDEMTYIS